MKLSLVALGKLSKLVTRDNIKAVSDTLDRTVSVAKALNSTQVYKGKDKVDKALDVATKANTALTATLVVANALKGGK